MRKMYKTLVIKIEKNGNLILDKLSDRERELIENRDIIYIYFGEKDLYVGQAINFLRRHYQHKMESNFQINRYNTIVLLYGELIDRNLDYIEKSLINLFIADNTKENNNLKRRIIRNKTLGNNSNYNKLEKEIDANVLYYFWEQDLNSLGFINTKVLKELKNSILFKYSPFSNLTIQQRDIIEKILSNEGNYIIEGGAGTGKTVLMTNLVAQIFSKFDIPKKIAVVVKSNWRNSGKKIFSSYGIKNVTVGTWVQIISTNEKYDYILVDESHRLPYKHGYQMASDLKIFKEKKEKFSLELLGKMTKFLILFYDNMQIIRPADTPNHYFQEYIKNNNFKTFHLETQFRITINDKNKNYSAKDYLKGIKYILQLSNDDSFNKEIFNNSDKDSYFGIVNSISSLFDYVERMNNIIPNSENRVLAGYSRKWISKNNEECFDWVENEKKWKWNSTNEDWINTSDSKNEIGSIHAVQGIDINCVGLIIGKDLIYRNGKILGVYTFWC